MILDELKHYQILLTYLRGMNFPIITILIVFRINLKTSAYIYLI